MMKKNKFAPGYESPQCETYSIQSEGSFCYSPQTEGTSLPGFNTGGSVGGYDDDNPYFG